MAFKVPAKNGAEAIFAQYHETDQTNEAAEEKEIVGQRDEERTSEAPSDMPSGAAVDAVAPAPKPETPTAPTEALREPEQPSSALIRQELPAAPSAPVAAQPDDAVSSKSSEDDGPLMRFSVILPKRSYMEMEKKLYELRMSGIRRSKASVMRAGVSAFCNGCKVTCPHGHEFIVLNKGNELQYKCPVCGELCTTIGPVADD